ncbi:MAG: DUF58 domain-containing protein [Planctomycetaceae bacterium]
MKTLKAPDYMRLLPADLQARFARREFAIRGLVKGPRAGSHRSPSCGASTEFAEHREYSPGDDPRSLDWRVYGKQDRYCVKQYVEETNVRATILLDSSASMAYSGSGTASTRNGSISKFDYARQLAALVSYMFIRQGNSAGLIQFDSKVRTFLPAQGTVSHLRNILQTLHQSQPQANSETASVLHEVAERIPQRGIVIVISDLLTDVAGLMKSLFHLRHRLHDVVLFHVLSDDELTFPFSEVTRFRDLEAMMDELDVDPAAIRRAYLQQFSSYLAELEQSCKRIPCDYVRFKTSTPFESELSHYLARRAGGVS